jgi:phosphohistidine phosphatase
MDFLDMVLYLLRHAIAVERGTPGYARDSDRPLTPEGERKMAEAAIGMKAMGLDVDRIISSPYLRARRTAELVADVLGGTVEFSDALASDGDTRELVRLLQTTSGKESAILLVGHEPYLSGFISELLSGSNTVATTLKKGGLCKLHIEELSSGGCASLEWLLTPHQLRLFR